jgi:adenylate cyclase
VETKPITRRLIAIVVADVVGYTRLMEHDEGGTHARLHEIRDQVVDPEIAALGGRIVKTAGDGMLVEFGSAAAALRFAIEVQRAMSARNQPLAPDEQIQFRIGINLGDIIVDGNDIAGDGVNVAARLETLSEPGGICVSAAVRDQIHEDLSVEFTDIGEQHVKNIARPIRVYRVAPRTGAYQQPSRRRWQRLTRAIGWRWFAAGVLALGLAGIAVWVMPQFWKTAPALTSPPLSVAILPFAAPAGSPADEQFAAALTRDLTLGLGRTRTAQVVSQSAVATYEGKAVDVRAIGRELNVRYIVEGEVRRDGERIIVDVQLIDAGNARQAWSGRLELEEARAAQDRSGILARLTNRLRAALVNAEVARADKPPASDASAIEFWLYGRHVWAKDLASLRGALESRKLYDQALRLDPSLVPALVDKAGTLVYELYFNSRADHDRLVQEMDELSFRAVSIDDQYPPAWDLRGIVLGLQWRWEAALEANAIARRLDPTRDDATITERAELMFFMGRPTEALALVDQALALEPSGVIGISWPLDIRCRAYMALGRNDEAIAACEKSVGELDWWMPHLYLIAAYTHTGDAAKAAAEKAKLLQQRPGISIADFKALRLSNDPAFLQQTETHLFADLRKAGIPEK